MKNAIFGYCLCILICPALLLAGSLAQETKDALKVQHLLKTLEKHAPGDPISAVVTEQEFNAYIDYRCKQEMDTLIQHLSVQMLGEDRISGDLRLDAKRMNLDMIIGDDMAFEFKGRVVTRKGAVHLEIEYISLNGRVVQPVMLNMVLKALAIYYGRDIGSVDDWYELPKGVDRVRVDKGAMVLLSI